MSLYDQQVVLGACMDSCVEHMNEFVMSSSASGEIIRAHDVKCAGAGEAAAGQILPSPWAIDYILRLAELSACIHLIIDFIDESLECLSRVDKALVDKPRESYLAGVYSMQICIVFVAFMRRHFAYTLLDDTQCDSIFVK
jgi:hypothetical protein